mmetsp:Transcript_166364/g.534379  ORF Transcript_166364/g.534379 Transcript_166364/m.534379 type:complete len:928 (+) Transcript_166364:123-2906(+)|eukprot:CAMPEP_0203909666 /NCGR_PEP_ID=MMETSP0359-20131031/50952_1 /ASSEMBLY_ACC=CAM_ASM_000338 /TAXON_ID=268821 /ORGANISM="Scrippsiella Hangoei, Strain SHTV-5" /LENGTH=927 /DNA_ID=CAMNT_0050834953 /DNA_START=70 /DNA_END=2850 /DNA_ORIENTATION=-
MPRGKLGAGRGGAGLAEHLLLRAAPIVALPVTIVFFQASQGELKLPLVFTALALGVVIAAAVRNSLLATLTTVVAAGLLLSATYVQELQAADKDGHLSISADGARRPGSAAGAGAVELAALPVTQQEAAGAVGSAGHGTEVGEELASATMETMSVVLPCAFEGEFAVKTVMALQANTRRSRLMEIIVVDDGSQPPLELPGSMLRGSSGAPVRLLRHEKTLGLIAAKKAGGDAAKGDVIVFFDCHVKPRKGWEEAFLRQMKRAGDHRTVVVPTITSLDPDTWEENAYAANSKACYMLWNADFTWLGNPGRDVPLMSGGLLALSRRWWQETEGYDPHMVAWGGENIDQSLRAWLCGGRIEVAEGAYVAHMWRDASNPKTVLKYPMKTEDVMRNKARAVMAWLQEYQEKTLSFPEYESFVSGEQSVGDMSNFDRVRKRLKCAPFSAYIQRFSYVYVDTGLIPTEIFQVREESTGRCLERDPHDKQPHSVVLAPCADDSGGSGGIPDLQLWHGANRDHRRPGAPCCSGLLNWNFLQCLDAHSMGTSVRTFECEISGHADSQFFALGTPHQPEQLVWGHGKGCTVPRPSPRRSPAQEFEAALEACGVQAETLTDSRFKLLGSRGSCLSVLSGSTGSDGGPEGKWRMEFKPCMESDETQVFSSQSKLGGLEIKAGASGYCLDSSGGSTPLVYPCYSEDAGNSNQIWQLQSGRLVWEGQAGGSFKAFCGHEARRGGLSFMELPEAQQLNLRTCTSKVGQRFKRHQEDASGAFLLRDEDTGKCLGAILGGGMEHPLSLGECHDRQRWRELADRGQVQHTSSKLCVDAGNEVTPIIYPCHEPKGGRKQRFRVVEAGLQLMSGWEDNGRKRYFEKCLDHSPEPPIEVAIESCSSAEGRGVRWSKVNPQVPLERKLWDKAPTAPPGSVGLGGPAEPPV